MRYNRAPSAWLYLILLCLIKESRVNLSAQFTHIQLPLQLSVRCIEQLEFFTGVVAFHFDNDYRRTFGKRDYPYILNLMEAIMLSINASATGAGTFSSDSTSFSIITHWAFSSNHTSVSLPSITNSAT